MAQPGDRRRTFYVQYKILKSFIYKKALQYVEKKHLLFVKNAIVAVLLLYIYETIIYNFRTNDEINNENRNYNTRNKSNPIVTNKKLYEPMPHYRGIKFINELLNGL